MAGYTELVKRKNILLIITKLNNGGAEKNIVLLADRLKIMYNVIIVTFDNSKQEYYTNAPIIDLKIGKQKNKILKMINIIKRKERIKEIKKNYGIDCSISFLTGPNFINIISKRNEKTIISIRNYMSKKKHKIINKILNRYCTSKADKVVCVCEEVRKDQINFFKVSEDKLITIYNTSKNNFDSEIAYHDKAKNIITIGRFTDQKAQWHIIRAFRNVVIKHPDICLNIIGRGPLKEKFDRIIRLYELEKNIKILKFTDGPEEFIKKSDIFILNSTYEGMSNVILEAMSVGIPIIATDCYGGNREIIEPKLQDKKRIKNAMYAENGVLVPIDWSKNYYSKKLSKQEKQLADVINELIENNQQRKKYAIQSKNRSKDFNDETNLIKWRMIIEE